MSRNLWSVIDQIVSQTQREVEQLARSLRTTQAFTSEYGFKDGSASFSASRTPQGFVVKSCNDGASVTLTVTLPLSASTPITIETTTKDGKSEIKNVSVNDYLKGIEVPAEVKAVYDKVKNYVSGCLPGFISESNAPLTQAATKADAPEADAATPSPSAAAPAAEFTTIQVPRNGGKTLQFEGKSLIKLVTHAVNGRFKEYTVYQTQGGKLIAAVTGKSLWPNETDRSEVSVCLSQEEVLTFFGNEAVTKRICKELGWSDPFVEIID